MIRVANVHFGLVAATSSPHVKPPQLRGENDTDSVTALRKTARERGNFVRDSPPESSPSTAIFFENVVMNAVAARLHEQIAQQSSIETPSGTPRDFLPARKTGKTVSRINQAPDSTG